MNTIIQDFPPSDGQDWECQCARCGSSADSFGYGHWYWCMSSPEWCEANPLKGREHVKRGEIEWFLVQHEERKA